VSELLPTGTVTLLIADLEGSLRLWDNQPEGMTAAVAQLDRTLSDVAVAHGGVRPVEQREGDSFVVVFGRASDAVACALELQRALLGPIRLRIGMHTGDALLSEEGTYIGPTVSRTARLRDLAHGGQTVLSRTTSDLVIERLPAGAWLTDLGTHPLGDLLRSECVVQLCHTNLCNDFPPLRTLKAAHFQNLPARLTTFVGRRAEIEELLQIITNNRLVTLTGAGGIGKTRLAVEVAARLGGEFADSMCYVDLAPITDPLVVPVNVARSLGIPDQPGRSTMDILLRFVGDREMLLLLDNCEHLLDACGALIVALLNACPQLTVLTTSREPINVGGELTWRVPSLSLTDEAIELFTDRARRVRPDFRGTVDNCATIADICRRLDGMPLAIELAAARVQGLSLTDILENLHDRFRLLTGGARTALHRHQTLRASVDWSYALLTEPEQGLFRRLGVFLGGFDLEAAQAVGVGAAVQHQQVMEHLTQLVDKSLVVAENASGAMRYRLLETMRQYALEKLGESGEADAVRDRHGDHYIERAAALVSLMPGGHQRLVDWADIELDNLRAAYVRSRENGDTGKALRLASSLQPFWLAQGRLREGMAWFDDTVPETPGPDLAPEVWVRAVVHTNTLAAWLEAPTGLDRARAALSIAQQLDDPALIAATLNVCSILTRYDAETSPVYVDEATELARASNDRRTLCEILLTQTIWRGGMAGDPRGARAAAEECRDLADALGDRFMSWSSRIWLGNALLIQGNLDDAARVLLPLVEQRAATGQLFKGFFANVFLGRVRAYQGQPDPAHACWEAALATATAMGGFQEDVACAMRAEAALAAGDGPAAKNASGASWRHTVPERIVFNRVLNPMPEALLACDELIAARQWADDTVATVHGSNKVAALTARAHIALAQGEPEGAARDAHDALTIAADTGAFLRVPDVVECLARLAGADGNHQSAARLFGAAAAIRDDKGITRFPIYQASYEAAVESCRDALGQKAFDAAWAEGAALSIEEAISYAQRGSGKRKRPSSGWESLTPTETAVMRLVSEGLANKDIAARLLISRRTVQTHLTHVYTKLGLTSRIQLVQEAARHA
jgi:predicted ATPase/class 3 adenylate cyclase/DNA-binding CsgD family transcriptional regulator